MSFPSGCSDHDFNYLMRLFRCQRPPAPLHDDEVRLTMAGWLQRDALGELVVTEEVERHFRRVWRPIIVEAPGRRRAH